MNILERFNAMEYGPAPESRKEADAWLKAAIFPSRCSSMATWRAASSGKTFETNDPATGKLLAQVSEADKADVDAAVAAAAKALPQMVSRIGL
jgi:aldehyde dehydrogenase (NAD+)